jgi:hypothetical protein
MLPRRSFLEVEIDGADISKAVSDVILDFTYIDRASGESDSIDLNVTDREGKFIDAWYPMQGAGAGTESGSSDYTEMARALQRGVGAAELQRMIDASDLTPAQGAELQRVANSSGWSQYVAEHPQYRGESGKLTLIQDIKGENPEQSQGGALSFRAKIHVENWNQDGDSDDLDTGKFTIDSCRLSGPPR